VLLWSLMGRIRDASAEVGRDHREVLALLADAIRDAGLDPADLGSVEKVRYYEGMYKDDDGEAHVVPMMALQVNPCWATGPEWPVVQQAAPVTIKPTTAKRPRVDDGWERAVILPDPQIGYRRYEDGTLDPFHDEDAIAVAMQVVRTVRPDRVVVLGDTLDFPEWGKYEQEPAFVGTTQPALDRTHRFLAEIRANAPEAAISMLEGNHDRRLQKSIVKNAMAAFGLRQAETPAGWPVMSVQHLLRLDELGVTYHDGYPAAECWINDNLVAIHGHKVNSSGSTASRVIDDERVSVIYGHIHRIELLHKTRRVREGRRQNFAACPGSLCRVDGAVPSVKGSTDAFGRPVQTWENWQQGLGVVTYEPGDGRFSWEQIAIHDGWAMWRDQEFAA